MRWCLDCTEYIRVDSLYSDAWTVDTSIYLGNYVYAGFDEEYTFHPYYPIYTLDDGSGGVLASISIRPLRNPALEFIVRFYDPNDLSVVVGYFWYVHTFPNYFNNTYVEMINENPFNGVTNEWIVNGFPGSIEMNARLFDTCSGLGFDNLAPTLAPTSPPVTYCTETITVNEIRMDANPGFYDFSPYLGMLSRVFLFLFWH